MLLLICLCASTVILFQVLITKYRKGSISSKSSFHIPRRLQHIGTGIIIAILYYSVDQSLMHLVALVPTLIIFFLDYLRRKHLPNFNSWFITHFHGIMRPEELYNRPPGAVYFLIGITVTLMLNNDRTIVYISIFNQTFCDPIASIIGILIGGPKISAGKSWSGSISSSLAGGLIVMIYNTINHTHFSIILGAMIAFCAEVVTIPKIDDNLSIPLITTLLYKLLFLIN